MDHTAVFTSGWGNLLETATTIITFGASARRSTLCSGSLHSTAVNPGRQYAAKAVLLHNKQAAALSA